MKSIVLLVAFAWSCRTEGHALDVIGRHARALSYPEDSEMGLFFALAVPLDDPVSTKAISVAFFFEANYKLPNNLSHVDTEHGETKRSTDRRRPFVDRRTVYSMLESKFESLGYPGRECLLRSICETARSPVHAHNGFLGDLLRIVLTPSSSAAEEGLVPEYEQAERDDRTSRECSELHPACSIGIYDYISQAYRA